MEAITHHVSGSSAWTPFKGGILILRYDETSVSCVASRIWKSFMSVCMGPRQHHDNTAAIVWYLLSSHIQKLACFWSPWALQVAEVHSSIWVDTSLIQMTTKWWKTILTWGLQYLKMYPHFMSMPGSIKRPDGPLKRTALELQGITLPDEGTAPQHHGRVVKDRVHQQPQAWQGHESSPAWDHGVPLGAVQIRSGDRPTYSLGAKSVQEAHKLAVYRSHGHL